MKSRIFIGVAGGSGSGKTTVSDIILNAFKSDKKIIEIVKQDAYYKGKDMVKDGNFDHPDSIEFELLKKHLKDLSQGKAIHCPKYDFVTSSRTKETIIIVPAKIIIVEGILIFAVSEIREFFDIKIFVDAPSLDVRLSRRIKRDVGEGENGRGRTPESVEQQFKKTVEPMHQEYCEPSKVHADIILPTYSENKVGINIIVSVLKYYLQNGYFNIDEYCKKT